MTHCRGRGVGHVGLMGWEGRRQDGEEVKREGGAQVLIAPW